MEKTKKQTRRLVGVSVLAAIVAVLQLMSYFVKVGPVTVALVLIPVVVGASVYGVRAGTVLGAVFGVTVTVLTVTGVDAGAALLFASRPFWPVFVIMLKCTAAGFCAGAVYKLLSKNEKNTLAVFTAAVVSPVVNTGIFAVSMLTVFRDDLNAWAGGTNAVLYLFLSVIGVNFVFEFVSNLVLSPAIVKVIGAVKRNKLA